MATQAGGRPILPNSRPNPLKGNPRPILTNREEKLAARDAKLYREHILKEQPTPELVSIGSIAPAPAAAPLVNVKPAPKKKVEEQEEVGSFGD